MSLETRSDNSFVISRDPVQAAIISEIAGGDSHDDRWEKGIEILRNWLTHERVVTVLAESGTGKTSLGFAVAASMREAGYNSVLVVADTLQGRDSMKDMDRNAICYSNIEQLRTCLDLLNQQKCPKLLVVVDELWTTNLPSGDSKLSEVFDIPHQAEVKFLLLSHYFDKKEEIVIPWLNYLEDKSEQHRCLVASRTGQDIALDNFRFPARRFS
jgi:hypothetical protein